MSDKIEIIFFFGNQFFILNWGNLIKNEFNLVIFVCEIQKNHLFC